MSDVLTGGLGGASLGAKAGPWGALAGGVLGSGLSFLLGDAEAEARKKAGLERARRSQAGNMDTLGQTEALAGASGLEMTGGTSMALHLDNMAAEFRRQNEWNVRQAQQGADLAGLANGVNLGAGLTSSLFNFGQSKNWFSGGAGPPTTDKASGGTD